ncbi:unnamed protein product [Periconia digitata]|uniref:Uncharacterized protein n=1 Tax=Periconia digitata TaxID=1303443 RepID=A0A9W4UHN2_9PLEO|nr:unnamed protein product [Periconia digitata]
MAAQTCAAIEMANAALSYVSPDLHPSASCTPAQPPSSRKSPARNATTLLPAPPSDGLPSLLKYVDSYLMRAHGMFDLPPSPLYTTCRICQRLGHKCPEFSTFLPLTPCGCWVHYRCFIRRACQPFRDLAGYRCPGCGITLFIWEGITALTLLTRTGLDIPDCNFSDLKKYGGLIFTENVAQAGDLNPHMMVFTDTMLEPTPRHARITDSLTGKMVQSLSASYESDCALIETYISSAFHSNLQQISPYLDGSPDILTCVNTVLLSIKEVLRPRSIWLSFRTLAGELCWTVLVAIKMKRFLLEGHGLICGTLGWKVFECGLESWTRQIGEICRVQTSPVD